MSSDMQALQALAMKTDNAMRYFELVKICNASLERRCFIGLGKHAVFFMRQNWDHQIHEGGEIPYAHIHKVIVDKHSRNHVLLFLSDNRPPDWTSERLYIDSEQRSLFLRHFRCNWQTDYMWRIGKVCACPLSWHALTKKTEDIPEALPFLGWMWKEFQDYKFMISEVFIDQSNSIQKSDTGEFVDEDTGSNLMVHVHEMMTLDQTKCMKLDHIRWVAMQYKTNLLKEENQFYVLRNSPYQKRMNLGGDIASWVAWEMIIRTEEITLIVMLLRRQFLPPVCNNVQDIAVIMRVPQRSITDPRKMIEKIREVHLIADSMTACSSTFSVYREVVQTKLDTLRFDDDGVAWVRAYLKLAPRWRREAKQFIRKILQMYIQDHAMEDPEGILNVDALHVIVNGDSDEAWRELPDIVDIQDFYRQMRERGDGLPDPAEVPDDMDPWLHKKECEIVRNNWHLRVARYFAWAVDGGMMGSRFDLERMIQGFQVLTETHYKISQSILGFLLHMRKRDMKGQYDEASILSALKYGSFDNNLPYSREGYTECLTFNENVMMALLRSDYIRKSLFGEQKRAEYYGVLGQFLKQGCGVDLKAYICRLFMEGSGKAVTNDILEAMIPPLSHLLSNGGPFLATYASAALVNLSSGNDQIKTKLMSAGIPPICCQQLKAKDDDLVCYILMLLVNLTKEPQHRSIIRDQGMLVRLYDILTSTYAHSASASTGAAVIPGSNTIKIKILTQVCIIIGQFCNEANDRKGYQKTFEHTVPCLVYLYMQTKAATLLSCKALFAMKQVIIDSNSKKIYVSKHVARKLVEEVFDDKLEKTADFFNQAILLLQALANHSECISKLDSAGLTPGKLDALLGNKICKTDRYLLERIENLSRTMRIATDHAADM